jgi:DNA polymerase-3 subunit beta
MRTTEYIMAFRGLREEFLTALDAVRGFTSSSKNEPALQAVKVETKNDSVTFSATDGDVYALFTMTPGDTRGGYLRVGLRGAATLPSKEVRELVRATKDLEVELCTSKGVLTVESRSYKALFKQGADAAAFPAPPKIKEDAAMATISGKDLQRLIKNTAYAAGKGGAFYNVTSILFEYSKNGIKAVATDGYRLAIDKAPLSESKGLEGRKTLISGKALDNFRRAIPKDEDVEILLDDEYVQFKAGRFTLIAPCGTEGKQFPEKASGAMRR